MSFYSLLANQPNKHTRMINSDETAVSANCGRLVFVGAGPGDPGLLTLDALSALQKADIIIHDHDINPQILELCRVDAILINRNKTRKNPSDTALKKYIKQLLAFVDSGKTVVRLRVGDAYSLSADSKEEVEPFFQYGLKCQIIPGITNIQACSNAAHIPFIYGDRTLSVTLASANPYHAYTEVNWRQLATNTQTLAVDIEDTQIQSFCAGLLEHGRPGNSICALLQNTHTGSPRKILTTLHGLAHTKEPHEFASFAVLLIGPATGMSDVLHWFSALETHQNEQKTDQVKTNINSISAFISGGLPAIRQARKKSQAEREAQH